MEVMVDENLVAHLSSATAPGLGSIADYRLHAI
jgi:hypothetical protein